MPEVQLNDKRVVNGWAFFDWANSAYALVITGAIFPAYYIQATSDMIRIGSMEVSNSALFAYAVSAAYLIIACFSPLLSGIADYGGRKKSFMKFFTALGSISCISLFFFTGMENSTDFLQVLAGNIPFIFATIGFAGAIVFYNAYLPEIVTEDRYDRVSARGFAYGYIGSVILMLLNLIMIMNPTWFGLPAEGTLPIRLAFVTVGLWWIGFAQIAFRRLPPDRGGPPVSQLVNKGAQELLKVWRIVRQAQNIKRFLLSFFFYSAGAQTIMFLAATFAEKELHLGTVGLIQVVLILQIVAIGGAYFFAFLSGRIGNKLTIIIILLIWMTICWLGYFIETKLDFYIVAASVGFVMGGIQSMSRSTYSKLIPAGTKDTTSFFSFYDILEKVSIVIGTFSFGFVEQFTGGIRNSIIALGVFFIIGILILLRVRIQRPSY